MSGPDYRCSQCDQYLCICEANDYRCVNCHCTDCRCKGEVDGSTEAKGQSQ
jgi:hypothetical protein